MATKPLDIEKLLRKYLGKEAAAALLAKIDKMAKERASAAAIEKVIGSDLRTYIEKHVVKTVLSKIPNIEPAKAKQIEVRVGRSVRPIEVMQKSSIGVSVKVGPEPKSAK